MTELLVAAVFCMKWSHTHMIHIVYHCLHGSAPGYLATWRQIFSASQTLAPVGDCVRRLRQRLSLHVPCVLPSATKPSRRLLHLSGTVCRRQYDRRRHWQFSAVDWRLNFLLGLTAALTNKRFTALTTTWPHYYCYVSLQS